MLFFLYTLSKIKKIEVMQRMQLIIRFDVNKLHAFTFLKSEQYKK